MFYHIIVTIIYNEISRSAHWVHPLSKIEWLDQILFVYFFLVWLLFQQTKHSFVVHTVRKGILYYTVHIISCCVWGVLANEITIFKTDLSRMKTWSTAMWVVFVCFMLIIVSLLVYRMKKAHEDKFKTTLGCLILTPLSILLFCSCVGHI